MGDTLRKFRITFRDSDPAAPVDRMTTRAYDREHAEEKFWDSIADSFGEGDDGWTILKIEQLSADPVVQARRDRHARTTR